MQGSIDFSGVLSGAISGEGGGGAVPVVTATATVDNNTGVPEVAVTRTGSDENPNFNFGFKNLKGAKGDPGTNGSNGLNGSDGFSPAVTITDISNGHRVSITDATHPSGQIFDVMNGANGRDGSDGQNGTDGVSPAVTIGDITGGHSVTITDATHPLGQTFNVMNGQDGATGATGATGPAGPGLPAGGAIGQIIYKASNTDYHTEWGNIPTYDADDVNYDPIGRDYITAVNVQGAIDELDGECAAINNSLTQLETSDSIYSASSYANNIGGSVTLSEAFTDYKFLKIRVGVGSFDSWNITEFLVANLHAVFSGYYVFTTNHTSVKSVRLSTASNNLKSISIISSSEASLSIYQVVGIR